MSDPTSQTSGTDAPPAGYCRNCGRLVDADTARQWQGSLHCVDCYTDLLRSSAGSTESLAAPASEPPPEQRAAVPHPPPRPASGTPERPSPVLAVILGLIPGVGAVYNQQYAKGVAHVVIFGGLISLIASDASEGLRPMFGLLIFLMAVYMPLEAYRTARALERGRPVEELSGFLPPGSEAGRSPALGIVLIVAGVVFLLHTMGYWRIVDLLPYWPILLIALGVYLLYRRVAAQQQEELLPPSSTARRPLSSLSFGEGGPSPAPPSEGELPEGGKSSPEQPSESPRNTG